LDFFKALPGEETTGSVCDEDSPSSFSYHKKVWISTRLHRGKRQKRVCAFNGCLKLLVLQYMDSCV